MPARDEQLRVISQGFVAIGDSGEELQNAMRRAGFAAFAPYQRFMESFANSAEDLENHRRYLVEKAKSSLAPFAPEAPLMLQSPFLGELKTKAESSPLNDDPATAWIPRLHIDPCKQNALALEVRNRDEYARREQSMLEQRETQLRIEAQRHSSALSNRDPDGTRVKASRFQFAQEVVLKELAPIGIEASRRRVSKGGVIAFKTVSPSFSLAFSLGEVDLFFRDSKGGLLILHLTLRTPEGLQGPGPGRTYLVRYQELVEGLATAYLAFSDLETLQTHIKAQLHLFRMVEPRLTAAIRSAE